MKHNSYNLTRIIRRVLGSIWLFPGLLTVLLFGLTAYQINGSSLGIYSTFFASGTKDQSLLINKPLGIRSDEWLVNTQMTIAQQNNDYKRVNQNIGGGEDVSLMLDVPYKDWSIFFKPQNLAFFVLPFDNAFAFRWWIIGYLLVLSVYFFTLELLPGKRFLAALLGLGLFFTPFIQWWYVYGTLGSIYYCLFAAVIVIKILKQPKVIPSILWGVVLTYTAACFAVILYPPFQIACALAMAAFMVGYLFETLRTARRVLVLQKLGVIIGSLLVALAVTATFLLTRLDVVNTIAHTAYPGDRIQKSGGYDAVHLFSNDLQFKLQMGSVAGKYRVDGPLNQSEASNFVYLIPFLLLPTVALLRHKYRPGRTIDWPLLLVSVAYLSALVWLFVPNLPFIGKFTLLERIPHSRLLIGLGLLNFVHLVLFIRAYLGAPGFIANRRWALFYVVLVFMVEVVFGVITMNRSPGFIGLRSVLVFSLPIPFVTYLLLRKHFIWAAGVLLLFLFGMTYHVNPLYRSTAILENTGISQAIKSIASHDNATWATEVFVLENFIAMNGAHSLSGVYTYPQLSLWKGADNGGSEAIYNRYAHTSFAFDRAPSVVIPTKLTLIGGDNIRVITEPCSDFLRKNNVHYLLTQVPLNLTDTCASLIREVKYPAVTYYIYYTK